ncbi:MAG: hypothetical protein ACR2FE_12015 [Aeromicrobium sp.]
MKRVLFRYGKTIGWVVCEECARNRYLNDKSELAHLTVDDNGVAFLFIPDWLNAATFRRMFTGIGRSAYVRRDIASLTQDFQVVSRCKAHGDKTITLAHVLAARGSPDAPKIARA